jgi:hypothetical protein
VSAIVGIVVIGLYLVVVLIGGLASNSTA